MTHIKAFGEFEIIVDKNIKEKYKYPSGYKDGNKLGKRKRNLIIENIIIINKKILCSKKTFEIIKKNIHKQ